MVLQVSLLRKLMRIDSHDVRCGLLRQKMAPKKVSNIVIAGVDGNEQDKEDDGKPEVPPREFAQAISDVKLRFGNVDEQ